jgi:hypothetical protein
MWRVWTDDENSKLIQETPDPQVAAAKARACMEDGQKVILEDPEYNEFRPFGDGFTSINPAIPVPPEIQRGRASSGTSEPEPPSAA